MNDEQIGRHTVVVLTLLAVLGGLPASASSQTFPSRQITLVYPYVPGGALEIIVRQLSAEAAKLLGQPIVQENKPGANARMGVMAFKQQSKADGHLISFAADTLLVHQTLADPNFKLEIEKDYTPVTFLVRTFQALAIHPSLPFRDVKGLVSYAQANPGKLNWAYTPGSVTHFGIEMFKQATGIDVAMIPFKGGGEVVLAHVGGQVDAEFNGSTLKPHIDAGKLIAIATTGRERWGLLPGVPSLNEAGVPMTLSTWFGLVAPAGTPQEAISKLYLAYQAAFKGQDVIKRLQEGSYVPEPTMTPSGFGTFIKAELTTWAPIIQKAGIKMQ